MTAPSTRKLLALACVVVALGTATYYLLRPRAAVHPLPQPRGLARTKAWVTERMREWQQDRYVELRDSDALAEIVAGWVRRRPPEGPEIVEGLLVRDITRFLHNLSAKDADEYLEAVADRREFRGDIADDAFIHACYHEMTGRTMALDIEPRRLMAEFWESHPDALQRPVAASSEAYLEVARSKPASENPRRHSAHPYRPVINPVFSVKSPGEYVQRWEGPSSRALIRLTRPRMGLEQVAAKHDVIPVCVFGCSVKTSDGAYGVLHAWMYFSPDENAWHVELAWSYFGDQTYWPM